ncbi:MAG: N-methyl-L-tryptophan oxidase [Rhodospirillaceae bacterium]|jgi:sarcosine oxidase|nr:N-methyl-L-tryptophan oxidase [Rhodospirillaceae bacterium]MBT6205820.1 N-methyl-L-tryptophan oxidase [Rhodospirillaceae bacterium]MBT6510649.1 N-methyl-L-tryptophan oxidase [Rhodospirillaceae bacterium]MBT7611719.1 N-methyl-L-tryptophan oxidase [Rhodospirillaceae bacterium]MBT7647585.1 N-methyl-L-tryptophan oxidase [Rhodospirillaceae bacterium]
MEHVDVIVVGLGVMGSAAAYHCARRGGRTLGIDANPPYHKLGSSHGVRRATRETYFEAPDYVPLVQRSFDFWRGLEAESGKTLLTPKGAVYVAPAEHPMLRGVELAARTHGLGFERLSRSQSETRFPGFAVPQGWDVLVEQRGSVLEARSCLEALATRARQHGAELRYGQTVTQWRPGPGGSVIITTADGEIAADSAIVTVGPCGPGALSDLALPIRAERRVLVNVEPERPETCGEDQASVFFWATPEGVFGGFLHRDGEGAMVARHDRGDVCTPESVHRDVTQADHDEASHFFKTYIPGAAGPVTKSSVCLYTMTPDNHFIVDRHPGFARLAYAAGFCGHGFKFAPVIGESLADLALDGATANPIGFLSADRFKQAAA